MSIIKLNPACKSYLWGGQKLKADYHKHFDGDILAETWELSCHPDGPSTVADGPYAGKTLPEYLQAVPAAAGINCARFRDFPVLIKLIDAKRDLSIQVHPDNAYALKNEGQFGKTEMWYVVDCDPGAFLYYGFQKEITKEEFRTRIQNGTLTEVLNAASVKPGSVFFIESGTIHAIGKGIVIAEIQQNSNITYRVFDYNRLGTDGKPRQLHVQKALDVTRLTPPRTDYDFGGHLGCCDSFVTDLLKLNGSTLTARTDGSTFHSLLVTKGEGSVTCGNETVTFQQGDSLFLPADSGVYSVTGHCEIIRTTVPPATE
ncbi:MULTISPECIES: type I phosphomannose isomerase catalytic subunit [Caproicibacterium]|uniref:Phosphohexomutase n=1 Tax=Caproicibacterium lactatifermentans TaxID=2666138 RepID=A0A859DQX0_9FIRM|nr:type I phosphomannose isomerase catalytic subunit [Caproicibacterium lactatifermentans]ARP49773.1 mannose-6-phosphate isomerase [Ruminococcaceae bacterium CPB6]MDD4807776.1 class I mannose-6-phosphate isomerase [Oscillospiraceae bacterium]QKN24497.1 mannose-6-phosphate isomerase [Caproicibacterium lactatifermentans]QKO30490.1 mannose-6-phosphate isomerase [Caproicibacterium lactatifermentans]